MAENNIELKGSNFTLFVLSLINNDLSSVQQALFDKVQQAPAFFSGAPIVINVSQCEQEIDFLGLAEVLKSQQFVLVGITGSQNEEIKQAARQAGLAVLKSGPLTPIDVPAPSANANPVVPAAETTHIETKVKTQIKVQHQQTPATQFHHGQLRSGQQIYAKDKNLVIIGSVSAGAEVIADGSIHVYGHLRGRAIAGAKGDSSARIFCRNLEAELISINGNYKLSETLQETCWQQAATVSLENDQLIISRLD
ncbi:septum site-determining protein MinC [Motilimonas eburnea]|uniref:septum site-determining protein MinC n=1 Tax=Motilimonas eburnea TaxID=1737488 RepID=UPI001E411B52|nr:septum site-determining protein MinC [Motilimonas eburnea]MCE2571912.1 septum site-determining protein MinC [Motilimonas eburnea]